MGNLEHVVSSVAIPPIRLFPPQLSCSPVIKWNIVEFAALDSLVAARSGSKVSLQGSETPWFREGNPVRLTHVIHSLHAQGLCFPVFPVESDTISSMENVRTVSAEYSLVV